MLLKKIKLSNIRSYDEEEISFPEGSTLLSGDIGAGKSSLLLAVEFALLRKGSSQGYVELEFKINELDVCIKRTLKKEKDAIKQMAGHIIVNNQKKELTAVELKAEIISLLGYPEDMLTKNKNYIYRYTVYCPQEEMRYILQENPELRLDSLRKIFNVDKYKNIRENLQLILKKMRVEILVLTTTIEPMPAIKEEIKAVEHEENNEKRELGILNPQLLELSTNLKTLNKELVELELEQKNVQELIQKKRTNDLLLHDFQKKREKLLLNLAEIREKIRHYHQEDVESKLKHLEEEKNIVITNRSQILANLQNLQKKIKELQEESSLLQKKIGSAEEKQRQKEGFLAAISKEEEIRQKDQQLKQMLDSLMHIIVQNETILSEAQRVKEEMLYLNECPTCLQEVSDDHKLDVIKKENLKIEQAIKLSQESKEKKDEILRQKGESEEKLKEISLFKSQLAKIGVEIEQIEERKERLLVIREQLLHAVQENNSLMKILEGLNEENINNLVTKIKELHGIQQLFIYEIEWKKQDEQLQYELQHAENQLGLVLNALKNYEQKIIASEGELDLNKGLDNDILTIIISKIYRQLEEKKRKISIVIEEEKKLSVLQAQLATRLTNNQKQKEKLTAELHRLQEQNSRLIRLQEMYHWLEEYFLKLTYSLEKQVMLQIHYSFNSFFQEWFSILIDDEEVTSRIDDTFTPVIEQNGYEIGFSNLSGGEKTSAALAYRLALNRAINDAVHDIKTKDLLILDEPTDGFSSEQLDKVREVLDKLGLKQMLIVSHESKIESFVENVIRIGKNEQVSRVV
ncbi:SMC family ATPase [Candidatus Woesearchaeota archaeon]|nr:SMC family ATPase [Candidatus Woesearchaeota archaeon]